ncbi:MAG: cyclic nucleotide-binding domain-containing protein [Thermostichales cyanobacterium HHBFW_bins_127]
MGSERFFHRLRWGLTLAWLLLLASLLWDPITPHLTAADATWSPLRWDPERCILVQGQCLGVDVADGYGLGAAIFWGLVVPSAIVILLIFGHDLWRRICPLSFLSQIPRALGKQRTVKRGNRLEVPRIKPDSWLGQNYLLVQLSWFFVGLCLRILLVNGDRLWLFLWIAATIVAAITVGYLYGGKSWCNYFCPMAPVQKIYGEPRALFTQPAHLSEAKITQSMCRTWDPDGQEKSACVACQSPCIDIDAERSYWDGLTKPYAPLLYYGYVGLVVGYFLYYYLYAGNWDYYMSGVWAVDPNPMAQWGSPGWYIGGWAIPVPKLVAVPLTLGVFTYGGYWLGCGLESWLQRRYPQLGLQTIRHRLFSLSTWLIFNFFFLFAGRSWLNLLPAWVGYLWETALLCGSLIWLIRTWGRDPERYNRESLSSRLRKQLKKMGLDLAATLGGKSLDQLGTDEVFVLAKVLPSFTQQKRLAAYKEVLREALEEGYVNSSTSLQLLANIREELDISADEHSSILTELGVEDPGLLDPNYVHSLENSVRLNGYRKALDRLLRLQQQEPLTQLRQRDPQQIKKLRQDYCITDQEEAEILAGLEGNQGLWQRAQHVLQQLEVLIQRFHALNQPRLSSQGLILSVLRTSVRHKKRIMVRGLLEMIEEAGQRGEETAYSIAHALSALAPGVLPEVLSSPTSRWQQRLPQEIIRILQQPEPNAPACSISLADGEIAAHLQALTGDSNPIIQAASLFILDYLEADLPAIQPRHPLVQQTLARIRQGSQHRLADFPGLEKLAYFSNHYFFTDVHTETLLELSELATIKTFRAGEIISDETDTCRELLLLISGHAQIQITTASGQETRDFVIGELLDELEVLSQTHLAGRIIATETPTRIIALPVDALDAILLHDRHFARKVLELETRRLKHFVGSGKTAIE